MSHERNRSPILDASTRNAFAGAPSFTLRHRLLRAAFGITWLLLARWTPAPLRRWRNLLLRLFGARLHSTANIYGTAIVWYPPHLEMDAYASLGPGANCYSMAMVRIGTRAVISQGAYLCTGSHDIDDPNFQLFARPIEIGAHAWVAADAFVGPGVTVGEGAVLGARGVATKPLEPWTVYAGNPARARRKRAWAKSEGQSQ